MIIVSDTGPLHYLILIGQVELLRLQFGRLIIPAAVFSELQHEKTPAQIKAWMEALPDWIEVKTASADLSDVERALGLGEREAIALAVELNADAILMDDRKGIREASARKIKTITTLNILVFAAVANRLDLAQALHKLSQTNFYLPGKIIEQLLQKERARKQAETSQSDEK